ncbi:hypothetical protein Tco_1414606 [Tanacetum coccineum]
MLRKQHKFDDSHYDMPLIYYIEGHSLHFGRLEFAFITGLPFGPISFALYTSGELKFRNRVFSHKLGLSVTNLDVIDVIEDEETFRKLGDEDSIRLCLILFRGYLYGSVVDMPEHVPKALIIQHHSLYETYLSKLEKSQKRAHSSCRVSSSLCTTHISTNKKWLKDEVISDLNVRVFKLETIIQVLARERNEEYGV